MNYFELYGIPVAFRVDEGVVKKKFYALSRQYHPDFHAGAGQEQQDEALRVSADINRAYKIFQRPDELIRYLLTIKGLLQDEEKFGLDAGFLSDVMEINEQLMDLEMEPNEQGLNMAETSAKQLLDKIYGNVAGIFENYQEDISTEKELLQVKDYYFRKKYLQRILDKITQMRNIASP